MQAVIAIAQLARTVSIDFKFPEHINLGLSALTRSTKEAALLLSGSSFRAMDDSAITPKPSTTLAPIHAAGLGQPGSSQTALSPMGISPLNISPLNVSPLPVNPNYAVPAVSSPAGVAFGAVQNGGLNKFDATIVQMRQGSVATQGAAAIQTAGVEGQQSVRPPAPPIVSIPLPRE